jgi:hypothetical protein
VPKKHKVKHISLTENYLAVREMPGFDQAAEPACLARPGWHNFHLVVTVGHHLCVEPKDPITVALFETHHATVTPRPASSNRWTQVKGRRANSPRSNKARQLIRSSTLGPDDRRPAGAKEKNERLRNIKTKKWPRAG